MEDATIRRSSSESPNDSNEETSADEGDTTSSESKSCPLTEPKSIEAVPLDPNALTSLHGVIQSLRNSASDTHKFTYLLILAKILNQ